MKALRLKLAKLRAVASPEFGPSRETLRAFYLALIQAKVLYASGAWWFHPSVSNNKTVEALHTRPAHVIAGVPMSANRTDILKEARLHPLHEVATERALEYYLKATKRGGLGKIYASALFRAGHKINSRLQHVASSYTSIDRFHDPVPHTGAAVS